MDERLVHRVHIVCCVLCSMMLELVTPFQILFFPSRGCTLSLLLRNVIELSLNQIVAHEPDNKFGDENSQACRLQTEATIGECGKEASVLRHSM